jgi:DnaJ family protein C protein 9
MESLEAKYGPGGSGSSKKGKKRASTGGIGRDDEGGDENGRSKRAKKAEAEPTEEEFAAIQAKIDARRNAPSEELNGKKGGSSRRKSR